MSTPESKVKKNIDKILDNAIGTFYSKPVQNGMGTPMVDYHGCSQGRYFAIEAKPFGEKPTKRQLLTLAAIHKAGGFIFVIYGGDKENKTLAEHHDLDMFLC